MAVMTDEMQPAVGADDPAVDEQSASQVLCTIMDNGDGSFTLVKPDEAQTPPGDVGAADAGMGDVPGTDDAGETGERYEAPGELLKAVLDLVQGSGNDGGESDFQDGYTGADSKPTSRKMSPAAARV